MSLGNISIVKAMSLLLFEAIQNGNNQYFIFRSASCLPLTNFNSNPKSSILLFDISKPFWSAVMNEIFR